MPGGDLSLIPSAAASPPRNRVRVVPTVTTLGNPPAVRLRSYNLIRIAFSLAISSINTPSSSCSLFSGKSVCFGLRTVNMDPNEQQPPSWTGGSAPDKEKMAQVSWLLAQSIHDAFC